MVASSARRQTRRLIADEAGIAVAATLLRAGELVAFPTETVYGLGAHALDPAAAASIFVAKQRPPDDPLIVHIADAAGLARLAEPSAAAVRLAEQFWPGPLTLVLPRQASVPDVVTAGLGTVAVRVPAHPVAQALLRAAQVPVAAPSANLFGRPSPTLVDHVLADLDGRIAAVLDGGPTTIGLESTIVDLSTSPPRLLRPGGLPSEVIEAVLHQALGPPPPPRHGPQLAPGMLPMHYAPRTPLVLVADAGPDAAARLRAELEAALAAGQRVGVLALREDAEWLATLPVRRVEAGALADPRSTAARLFAALRTLDAADLDVLFARELADPATGLGRALADRLRRAARRVILSQP